MKRSEKFRLSVMQSQMRARVNRAFTIVEVLVALAIFTMMAVMLIASYLNVLGAYESMKSKPSRDLDLRFARNAMLAEPDFETAQKGDQFDGATGRHVTWTTVIEATNTADLYQVTFTCELGAGPTNHEPDETVVETFRLLRPTWSQTQNLGIDRNALRDAAKDRITKEQQPSPLSGITGSGGNSGSAIGGTSGGKSNNNSKGGGGGSGGGSHNGGGGQKSGGNQPRPPNPQTPRPPRTQ